MIQKNLLNTQMICVTSIKILNNTIEIKNEKYWFYLMAWLLVFVVINRLIQESPNDLLREEN